MSTQIVMPSLHLVGVEELKRRANWFLGIGIILITLGTVALASSVAVTLASMVFIGFLMIGVGILQAAHAWMSKQWGGFFLDLLIGLMNTAIGMLIIAHPAAASATLTLLIAAFLIMGGVFRIALAFSIRFHHQWWLAAHGAINLLLGFMIIQQWPVSGLWVIGMFISIDMICNGWTMIMLGMAAKRIPAEPV